MAEGILGLGQGQAAGLNNDMIEKLKAVDRKATVEPLEKKLENFEPEREAISNISTKVDEFLNALKIFSLNQTSGANAFHQKSANVYGEGVIFDAEDVNSLRAGSTRVEVSQLAQKDVWQSGVFDGTTTAKDSLVDQGDLTINGTTIDTNGKSYSDLVAEINKIDGVQASVVENSAGGFRLSVKSTETGIDNKINFSGSAVAHFGFDDAANNVLKAQDMQMKVDGVEYSNKSNTMTIDGLKITATKVGGDSTIDVSDFNTDLPKQMQEFANKYNEFKASIEDEIYNSESSVYDKSSLRNMLETVKQELFGKGSSDSSIFNFGFSLDSKSGDLQFNQAEFEKSIKGGTEELEKLFTGAAEAKGIATSLDEAITISGVKKSLLDYEIGMMSREDTLKKEKEAAETSLDNKYRLMSQQFAAYGVIINQMEASFSGLKMLIMQSQASK